MEQFNHNLHNHVLMTSYPNHQYRKMHLRKFNFLFVGNAEYKYRSQPYFLCCWVDRKWSYDLNSVYLFDLWQMMICQRSWRFQHQMNTHMRNSSIIFKNFCPRRISHHPKRCYLIQWLFEYCSEYIKSCAYQFGSEQSEQTLSLGKCPTNALYIRHTILVHVTKHLQTCLAVKKVIWENFSH